MAHQPPPRVSWIQMRPNGEYEAEVSGGVMRYPEWQRFCMVGLLFQRHRGGGTLVVIHSR